MLRDKDTTNSPTESSPASRKSELEHEQAYVTGLYERLDELRAHTAKRLSDVHGGPTVENDQAASERQSYHVMYASRRAQLDAVETGLCFGRLDMEDDERLYIGRVGLFDEEYEPLLVDWRAPVAQPFYRATPIERYGVVCRRHLHTKGRTVVDIDDDVLDLASLDDTERAHLTGEAALLASLTRGRTGRMSDIVATIQTEQDAIIRSELDGILVVEGGPGTGKTVVALHRAAYLLYTHRTALAKRGVLVIGPNATFVRYIDQVLPSLGETEVVLATPGSLYPGLEATATGTPEAAVVKGDPRMADVIARAVEDRQRVPDDRWELVVERETYVLDRASCARARARARELRDPMHGAQETHNRARQVFVTCVLNDLTAQAVDRLGADLLSGADVADIRKELREDPAVREAIDAMWPELTPTGLLAELYSSPERIANAAPEFTAEERAALLRSDPTAWSPADVPLLDEAAELIGELDASRYLEAREAAETAEQRAEDELYATQIVELLRHHGVISLYDLEGELAVPTVAQMMVRRYDDSGPDLTLAERALADRQWTYAHVIVDEAQELSAMAWRMLMRRCPARSMTVVGDLAQTGAPDGATSWARVLDPYAAGRWRRARLNVNYRTPERIMAVAADVLAAADPAQLPPRSVRETEDEPWSLRVEPTELLSTLATVVNQELAAIGEGRLAVIVPAPRSGELVEPLLSAIPGAAAGGDRRVLDAPVAVLTATQAKGLEFDAVLVVDPAGVVAESARGIADLYVALTRTTRRLGVVHEDELPAMLSRLPRKSG